MPSGGAFLQKITPCTPVFSESFILALKGPYGDLPFKYLMLDSECLHFLFCKDWLNKTITVLSSSALRWSKCQAKPCEDLLLLQRRGLFASAACPCHGREALSMMCTCIFKHLNYSIAKHLLWILRNSCNEMSSLRVSLRFWIYLNRFAFVCIFNNLLLFISRL